MACAKLSFLFSDARYCQGGSVYNYNPSGQWLQGRRENASAITKVRDQASRSRQRKQNTYNSMFQKVACFLQGDFEKYRTRDMFFNLNPAIPK